MRLAAARYCCCSLIIIIINQARSVAAAQHDEGASYLAVRRAYFFSNPTQRSVSSGITMACGAAARRAT